MCVGWGGCGGVWEGWVGDKFDSGWCSAVFGPCRSGTSLAKVSAQGKHTGVEVKEAGGTEGMDAGMMVKQVASEAVGVVQSPQTPATPGGSSGDSPETLNKRAMLSAQMGRPLTSDELETWWKVLDVPDRAPDSPAAADSLCLDP